MIKKSITVILGIYMVLALVWWNGLPKKKVMVSISKGMTAWEIANLFYEKKLLNSPFLFVAMIKATGKSKKLRIGSHLVPLNSSVFTLMNVVTKWTPINVKVTIPEGYTGRQIADILSENGIVNKEDFIEAVNRRKLEGYLFPNTYYFESKMSVDKVLNIFQREFNRIFTDDMRKRAENMKKMNVKKIIILASIIEKEAARAEERPIISAVFHNRLRKRMYLESCATILYALGKHKAKLRYRDLDIESPYNTYRRFGLPPGPICNPGLASIKAALYPKKTDALFFVVSSSGTHKFSSYYGEHLRNKKERKRRLRKQRRKKKK